jgi:hypothetical protein
MPKALNCDLGAFDPTFPGITLHFPNQVTWDRVGAVSRLRASLVARDVLRSNPQLKAEEVTAEHLIEHILADPDYSPINEEIKAQLARALMENESEAVENLAFASVHVHERRHFHDWLLSPWTAEVNALRVEVALNLQMMLPLLQGEGVTVLPVPLPRWLRKTAAEKEVLLRMWQALLGDTVEVRVPDIDRPDLLRCIAVIEGRYRSIGALFADLHGSGLSAAAVFEASALSIQTQEINDLVGDAACNLFLDTMSRQVATPYSWFVRAVSRFVPPGKPLENDTFSTLVTWCLLGSNQADPSHAHPVTRMIHVFDYLKANGLPDVDLPAHDILTALDRSCGAVAYADVLQASVDLGATILEQLRGARDPDPSSYAEGVLQTYAYFLGLHSQMVELFVEDPDGYAKPTGYLDRNLGKWPEPPVRHTFGQPFFKVRRDDLGRFASPSLFEASDGQDPLFLRAAIVEIPRLGIDLKAAENWQYLCSTADAIFAEYNRDQPQIEIQRAQARQQGIHMLEVLV